jgi:protoporphyrinogen oxidase
MRKFRPTNQRKLFLMPNIVVLGTGMAGLGAAYRLHGAGITPTVYDKNTYYGGHTASFRYENKFVFDVGPHISLTKDPRIHDLWAPRKIAATPSTP